MTIFEILFDTEGKITRKIFWLFSLGYILFMVLIFILGGNTNLNLMYVFNFLLTYPLYCVAVKRLNDQNTNSLLAILYVPIPQFLDLYHVYFNQNLYFYIPSMLLSISALIHLGFIPSEFPNNEDMTINNTIETKNLVSTFNGSKDLTNDAYVIFLTKKYDIEFNKTLQQYIIDNKLFETINDALKYADNKYQYNSK